MLPKAPVALGRHEISQFPRDVSPHVHSGEVHSGDAGLCGGISCFGSPAHASLLIPNTTARLRRDKFRPLVHSPGYEPVRLYSLCIWMLPSVMNPPLL